MLLRTTNHAMRCGFSVTAIQTSAVALLLMLQTNSAALAQSDVTEGPRREVNPSAVGLWMGEVTLNSVSPLGTSTNAGTPSRLQMRIVLHVDATGKVRLLKDAILLPRVGSVIPGSVIVTKPELLSSLPVARDTQSKANGRRFSSVAFDFTDTDSTPGDNALELEGGIGEQLECGGTITLSSAHPTNPFRHKFHPDHANTGDKAYVITREVRFSFTLPVSTTGGVETLSYGQYTETITGLHKAGITTSGTIQLSRITTTPALNE